MGVFDKFLDIMKLNDDDYDDDFYDEEDEYFDDEEFDEKTCPSFFVRKRKIRRKNLLMILIWKRKRNFSLLPQAR